MSAISLNHLTKQYKNGRGIHDISLSIEAGQVYGLLGPNGSGKTTIMKCMVGLIFPDHGEIKLLDKSPIDDIEEALKPVGCLIEHPSYYPYLTAKQNLEMVKTFYPGCSPAGIEYALRQVGLSPYQNEKVKNYSLGMKQRLGLAMALLHEPELLILDEPSNGLDIEGMAQVRDIIKKQSKNGKTVFISSHLAAELEQVCTNIAVIKDGELLGDANIHTILSVYGSIEKYYLALIHYGREDAS